MAEETYEVPMYDVLQKFINMKAGKIHKACVESGWWDNPNRCIYTCMQLIATEICEATEGLRKDIMDDHLPHRKMEEVELADALIRTLDLGGKLGLKYTPVNTEHMYFPKSYSDGGRHLSLTRALLLFAQHYAMGVAKEELNKHYSHLIQHLCNVAQEHGHSIFTAMEEKLEYNKTREDHKRENRAKEGGKKW